MVSGGSAPATVASGVLVTASGLVLTSRRAIGAAVDGSASVAMVRGGSQGRKGAGDLANAVPARLVAVSAELDLAVVEAMPAESVFYPHLPIARRTAPDNAGVLAVGHGKKQGLWSATMIAIGPAMGRAGADRWLRKLPAESSLLDAGTPLVDAVGRIVGLVAAPTANDARIAVDAEGLLRFLLASNASDLRFAGVPPYRRPSPGTIGIAGARTASGKPEDGALPLVGLVPARADTTEGAMPGVARKGNLDRRFPTAPPAAASAPAVLSSAPSTPSPPSPAAMNERNGVKGAAVLAFEGTARARGITLPDLDRAAIPATVRVDTADAPERGAKTAPVTIVQLGDYHAPETRDAETMVRALVEGESAPARLLWKDADRGDGEDYQLAARAARAAGEQDEFWSMHDRLLRATTPPSGDKVRKLARELQLDQRAFIMALGSDGVTSAIDRETHRSARMPVLCTPAFIVNGHVVDGGSIAGPALRAAVDDELVAHEAKAPSRPQRTIAVGAPIAGAAFDAAKMARVIADATARRSGHRSARPRPAP